MLNVPFFFDDKYPDYSLIIFLSISLFAAFARRKKIPCGRNVRGHQQTSDVLINETPARCKTNRKQSERKVTIFYRSLVFFCSSKASGQAW
jgi:hypothetical protein